MKEKKGACCWSNNRWFPRQQRTGITLALAQIAFIALGSTREVEGSLILWQSGANVCLD